MAELICCHAEQCLAKHGNDKMEIMCEHYKPHKKNMSCTNTNCSTEGYHDCICHKVETEGHRL